MAGYNTIRGLRVKYLSADPSNPEDGQVWYNAGTGNLRVDGIALAGSWAAGGNLNTGRAELGGCGIQTAGLAYGGNSSTAMTGLTEEYNGSSWSEQNNLALARAFLGSTGTQTAGLAIGGMIGAPTYASQTAVELYNGTSWTGITALSSAKGNSTAFGTSTAAYSLAGQDSAASNVNVEFYNGSSWSEGPNVNTGRNDAASAGLGNSGMLVGGYAPSVSGRVANTEEWNGSAWSNATAYPLVLNQLGGSGSSNTSAVFFAGDSQPHPSPPKLNTANVYDGTSWTATGSLARVNGQMGTSKGTQTALSFGGNGPPSFKVETEEFTPPGTIIKNLSTS
jgi:hypothetical protein